MEKVVRGENEKVESGDKAVEMEVTGKRVRTRGEREG